MLNRTIRSVIEGQTLVTLTPDMSIRHAAIIMAEHRIGAAPILEGGSLIGIFTERDMMTRVVAAGLDVDATRLGQVMTKHPETIQASRPVVHALHIMHEGGFRHLPVMEHGQVVGVISARDAQALELLNFERDAEFRESASASLGG